MNSSTIGFFCILYKLINGITIFLQRKLSGLLGYFETNTETAETETAFIQ